MQLRGARGGACPWPSIPDTQKNTPEKKTEKSGRVGVSASCTASPPPTPSRPPRRNSINHRINPIRQFAGVCLAYIPPKTRFKNIAKRVSHLKPMSIKPATQLVFCHPTYVPPSSPPRSAWIPAGAAGSAPSTCWQVFLGNIWNKCKREKTRSVTVVAAPPGQAGVQSPRRPSVANGHRRAMRLRSVYKVAVGL